MSQSTEQFIAKVAKIEEYLQNDFDKDIFVKGCLGLASAVANRVQETGILGSGKSYKYSKKPILVGKKSFENEGAWDKVLVEATANSKKLAAANKGKKKGEKTKSGKNEIHWITKVKGETTFGSEGEMLSLGMGYHLIVLPGGYAEIRRLENHLNTEKNYSRTKEMWRGFGIKKEEKHKVIIGGKSEMSQNKINWNSRRDKDDIILPTQEELDELTKYITTNIQKYINATLSR